MAENVLETRIRLRYAAYSQWMTSNIILQQGEAAIATFPNNNESNNIPSMVGVKIGDGEHYFYELPWIQAVAADVYDWAKTSSKPTYNANEIIDLSQYISSYISELTPGSNQGSGQYRIIYDSTLNKYILQEYDNSNSTWTNTTSTIDLSNIVSRLDSIENWANGGGTNLGNINEPLDSTVHDYIILEFRRLNYTDNPQTHQFVTEVNETNGKISVNRSTIHFNDINGILPVSQGGTGLQSIENNHILIGDGSNVIQTKPLVTLIESDSRNSIPTAGAVTQYVAQATAGLTGAMHFIGEATVEIINNSGTDPQITDYNFSQVAAGDVILYNNAEFVWTGSSWHLLGDEGSYVVKGSIMNNDIADEANISPNKIYGLTDSLNNKVDKIEGKGLSSNDYSTEEKEKLATVEENAQANLIEHLILNGIEVFPNNNKTVNLSIEPFDEDSRLKLASAQENIIEHVYLNGVEVPVTTIQNVNKIVNLQLVEFSQEEKTKLANIETEAQVNKVESIKINNSRFTPNGNKEIAITLDQTALDLDVLAGATIPDTTGVTRIEVAQTLKKLDLERIAVTGNVIDLKQTTDTYILLDCGSSTDVI